MPMGARNVALCFSAASMKMVRISKKVRNISMNRPRTTEVSGLNDVRTESGPGNKHDTIAAATIPAKTWARMSSKALSQPMAPTSARAIVT
jgi:hypothetical protein